jgi:hypothetical protein
MELHSTDLHMQDRLSFEVKVPTRGAARENRNDLKIHILRPCGRECGGCEMFNRAISTLMDFASFAASDLHR